MSRSISSSCLVGADQTAHTARPPMKSIYFRENFYDADVRELRAPPPLKTSPISTFFRGFFQILKVILSVKRKMSKQSRNRRS